MKLSRRTLVIIIALGTLLIGAVAVFVGIQIQQQQAPDDTSAQSAQCCQNSGGSCDGTAGNHCGASGVDANSGCSTGRWGWCATLNNPCINEQTGQQEGTPEVFCGQGNWDGSVTLTCPPGWRGGGTTMTVGGNGRSCNTTTPPTNPPPSNEGLCDNNCKKDSDCAAISPGGAELKCNTQIGRCVNKICPNDTIPGNNCHCRTPIQKCGQRCGNGYPLCDPATNTACRYIKGPNCPNSTPGSATTRCVPLQKELPEGYQIKKCVKRDTYNSYLLGPDGKVNFTAAEIQTLCEMSFQDVCGDGTVDPSEGCDDGNTTSGDGCSATCTVESCGDGIQQGSEQCDDGNNTNGDGCSATCTVEQQAACGDGTVDAGEQCDDGNTNNDDGCSSTCQTETCGDGILHTNQGEQCDDGNTVSGDGCNATCELESCGDGTVQTGEQCDDGNNVDGDGCSAQCGLESCGDSTVQTGEQCDDGNNTSGDGCSATCNTETCGDGIVHTGLGEECEPGATPTGCNPNSVCNTSCQCDPIATPPPAPLPDTALFDDTTDVLLLGMLLVIGGIIANRYGLLLNVFGFASGPQKDGTSGIFEGLIDENDLEISFSSEEEKFQKKVMRDQERRLSKKSRKSK